MRDLVSWPRIEAGPLHWEGRFLTTGPPGKSLTFCSSPPPSYATHKHTVGLCVFNMKIGAGEDYAMFYWKAVSYTGLEPTHHSQSFPWANFFHLMFAAKAWLEKTYEFFEHLCWENGLQVVCFMPSLLSMPFIAILCIRLVRATRRVDECVLWETIRALQFVLVGLHLDS